ncbi:hypothetical protein LTR37_006233 [Vermiconidia calcicola]|uniref:Uncharacterized protein n=1 Tax=Vermiconidia calcicola TaxID=1690605 RepID=A0ACC3NIA1_9PEZI|nr:hypothetical protein LTR37_006233 [Vermiconidia calcicola]
MASRIAIVLGAGPNIGARTIETFESKGYKVAYASRSARDSGDNGSTMAVQCDLSHSASVTTLFDNVRKKWGEPSVVVYNAAAHYPTKPEDSFEISTKIFEEQLAVNTTSAFVAAREAISSSKKLDGPKTFLYTGNMLLEGPYPSLLTLGLGKAASGHFVQMADSLYRDQNMRFHFVDERTAEGKGMFTGLGGQAHADFFLSLAERTTSEEVPWQATFVSSKGYTAFPHELVS